jgi:hypothetical protein
LPGLLIPKALVRIAPGKSIVVKVKQHRAHRAEMTPNLDNPDLGNIMLDSVVIRRIGIPPLPSVAAAQPPSTKSRPPSHECRMHAKFPCVVIDARK